jgi:hypothetical protein
MQKLQAGNHLQQDVNFLVQNALKLTYEHLLIEKIFRLAIARHERQLEKDPHDFYNGLTPLVEIQLFSNYNEQNTWCNESRFLRLNCAETHLQASTV